MISRLAFAALLLAACAHPKPTNALVAARPYHSTAPLVIDPARRYPLIVVLHGLGGSGENIERYWQLDSSQGFLAAYPDGTHERAPGKWPGKRFWNATDLCCDFLQSGVDDVAYLDAVIDDMSARYPVDAKRIFVGGLSNGGYMAYRYACDRAARVAAIVVQAGAMWSDPARCKPSAPVAVLQIHGTADRMVPYGGGPADGSGPSVVSAHQSVSDWVTFDHCHAAPDPAAAPLDLVDDLLGPETTRESWSGCRGVELWTMSEAPHVPHLQTPTWGNALYHWLMAHPAP